MASIDAVNAVAMRNSTTVVSEADRQGLPAERPKESEIQASETVSATQVHWPLRTQCCGALDHPPMEAVGIRIGLPTFPGVATPTYESAALRAPVATQSGHHPVWALPGVDRSDTFADRHGAESV